MFNSLCIKINIHGVNKQKAFNNIPHTTSGGMSARPSFMYKLQCQVHRNSKSSVWWWWHDQFRADGDYCNNYMPENIKNKNSESYHEVT